MAAINHRLPGAGRDVGGVEAVYLAHRAELLRFFRARAPDEDSEDLVNDLWLRVQAMTNGPLADPLPYLYRMANNLALDQRRSARRRRRRDHLWASASAGHGPLGASISGERIVHSRESLRRVERRLAELGERTATILRMFRVDGVPQERIAGELGISLSAVEKHLQKAYRALLAIVEEDGDGHDPRAADRPGRRR